MTSENLKYEEMLCSGKTYSSDTDKKNKPDDIIIQSQMSDQETHQETEPNDTII